jgi:nucleoside-diphosphate-sugar epimerase
MLTHLQSGPVAPRRVVLLGAHGFLTRHLQRALAARQIEFCAVSSRDVDLTQPDSAERLVQRVGAQDTVVMMSTLTPEKGRDYRTLMLNLQMGANVCRCLEMTPCAHFVYLSSDAVYDAHQIPLDEDSTREPVDLYALMHTAREMMLGSVLEKGGVPLCVLRPTNIYGPGDTHNNYGPNRFVRTALQDGRIVLFGKGEERRSHVFVRDAIELILRVLRHRSRGVLNLATRPAVSFRAVAELVSKNCPRPVHLEYAPRTVPVIHHPYKLTQVARFVYNLGRPISPVVHRTFAVSATFQAFPDFKFTPLEDGLVQFLRACEQEVAAGTPPPAPKPRSPEAERPA